MSVLLNEAKAMQDKLSWFRREIHKKPEVGMDLPITTAFVKEQLEKHGLKVDQIIDCGLSVLIEGGKPGKTILLRADMDALPLAEESGEEFASEFEGKSHGCGHDMHAASLIGTAILLNKYKDQIHGRVKLMWQPGEEIFEGMKAMIAAGIMENPSLDAALDLHVDASSPIGVLNFSKGPFTTSADNYLMKIKGSGCHGSMPETVSYTHLACGADSVSPASLEEQDVSTIMVGNSIVVTNSAAILFPMDFLLALRIGASYRIKHLRISLKYPQLIRRQNLLSVCLLYTSRCV